MLHLSPKINEIARQNNPSLPTVDRCWQATDDYGDNQNGGDVIVHFGRVEIDRSVKDRIKFLLHNVN